MMYLNAYAGVGVNLKPEDISATAAWRSTSYPSYGWLVF